MCDRGDITTLIEALVALRGRIMIVAKAMVAFIRKITGVILDLGVITDLITDMMAIVILSSLYFSSSSTDHGHDEA